MKIAFFIAHETSPYAGVVRPFINWSKKLSEDHEVYFLLLNCGIELVNFVKSMGNIRDYVITNTPRKLTRFVETIKPDVLITDDYIVRLKTLQKIKDNASVKTCIYVQVLFGIHSIVDVYHPVSLRERVLFTLAKLVPFNILKIQYKKLLQKHDIIIANSEITATLLHTLYGIEPHGVVYPPVDTEIFKSQNVKKKDQVLLYLGSHAGDTDENFVKEICKILKNKDMKILVMGNKILQEKLSKEFEIQAVSGVSDEELAKIYSECRLTICPQKWEQFGYVVAESIACGTPVLAFNMMGPKEIIEKTRLGFLANNKKEFLDILENIEKEKSIMVSLTNKIENFPFSITYSSKKLLEVMFHEKSTP